MYKEVGATATYNFTSLHVRGKPPHERKAIRQDKAKPILAEFRQWIEQVQSKVLPSAGLGVALVPMSHGRASQRIVVRPLRDAKDVRRRMGIAHRRTSFAAGAADRLASALTGQGA